MSDLEAAHRIALAREMTAAAGVPLRDRYGFAASDEDVAFVLDIVAREPNDENAVDLIGRGNFLGDIELAMAPDEPTDEEYEYAIVRALRPLLNNRRDAAARRLS